VFILDRVIAYFSQFNTRGLHLIKQDPALFDNGFFGISNVEAKAIDPQQRMMLEIAYEAFEDAGISMDSLAGSNTAVYCAVSNHDYEKILGRDAEVSPGYVGKPYSDSIILIRIVIDLQEPYEITMD
jgi:acyl transferase domain-containing protein